MRELMITDVTPLEGITEACPLAEGPSITVLFMDDGRVLLSHLCDRRASNPNRSPRFRADAGVIRCAPALQIGGGHQVVDRTTATLTISPSCLCEDCGLHGWITEGRWVSA